MNRLELKVPPPLVALVIALLMWSASRRTPSIGAAFWVRLSAALALALVGSGVSLAGIVSFRRAKTTINPTKPHTTSSLVTTSVYRYTRNPMYVGMSLELLAWAVFLASPAAFFLLPLFVWYLNRFQITPEERVLSSIFGAEYAAYKEKVRRWL